MPTERTKYRAIFISDLHLGSVACRPGDVIEFLSQVDCEKLYLVGDIIDVWVGTHSGKWRHHHNRVVQALLHFANRGSEVLYCPGNHDAAFRKLLGYEVGAITIDHQFIHECVDGRQALVVHGDLYDRTVTRYPKVAYVGAWSHEWLSTFDLAVARRRGGSFDFRKGIASSAKMYCKHWIKGKTRYDETLIEYARSIGCTTVVCGHTHKPAMELRPDGVVYANCGDWIEHCTAIVEHFDGRFELIWWKPGGIVAQSDELRLIVGASS